jgi:hypothetical protein
MNIITPIFKCKSCETRTTNSFGYCDSCWDKLLMSVAKPLWFFNDGTDLEELK